MQAHAFESSRGPKHCCWLSTFLVHRTATPRDPGMNTRSPASPDNRRRFVERQMNTKSYKARSDKLWTVVYWPGPQLRDAPARHGLGGSHGIPGQAQPARRDREAV